MDYLQRAKYFRTKKRLGQNFLINEEVLNDIVEYADLSDKDTVLEIGPGVGFLTEKLVKSAGKVIAVELDEEAVHELQKLDAKNLTILHQDILKTDISSLVQNTKIKVVANIPYYITTPILAHLLGEIDDLNNKNRNSISEIILMVQEEVARRMVATEKSQGKQFGLLSILSQFWADCSSLRTVGRRSFYPSPKVTSALVKLSVRNEPLLKLSDYSYFRKTIKAAFGQRRKNIKNALCNAGFDKTSVLNVLKLLSFNENVRAENLSINDLGKISEELCKLK
ncbi:ribosomal RNA small subunit methyltransferase A [bacterium]|nr:ribosomal RNA small subunit methyltransferase A [bacterium]